MKKIIYAVMLLLGMSIMSSCNKDNANSVFAPGSRWAACYFDNFETDEYGWAVGVIDFKKGGKLDYYMPVNGPMELEDIPISKDGHFKTSPTLSFMYSSTYSIKGNELTLNGMTVHISVLDKNTVRYSMAGEEAYYIRVAE